MAVVWEVGFTGNRLAVMLYGISGNLYRFLWRDTLFIQS